jgi:hypothetical protein
MSVCIREPLSSARTYYVRTDGNDSNDGLTNDAAGAFLTIQHAVDIVCDTLDLKAQAVVIQVADGAYNSRVVLKRYVGTGSVTIRGNTVTPANVSITTSGTNCITTVIQAGIWRIEGFKLSAGGGYYEAIYCQNSAISFGALEFGTCVRNHITCEDAGRVSNHGAYSISGGAETHITSQLSAVVNISGAVMLTGTPAFSYAFAQAYCASTAAFSGVTFTGTATGARYQANANGVVNTFGGGANYLPGNAAGVTATGGQYV